MGKTLNLSGEELCALHHVLDHALRARKWVAAEGNNGTGGAWVAVHSDLHKDAARSIIVKLAPKEPA